MRMNYEPIVSTRLNKDDQFNTNFIKTQALFVMVTYTLTSSSPTLEPSNFSPPRPMAQPS